ncbi:MAG: zinc-ribbon domain-containing protein, partial [Promethearchaeota archaeon]
MAKFCPYCGSQVKTTDKFCIICGKPLLTDIPKGDRKIKSQPIKEEEEIQPIEAAAEEQEGMEIKEEPFESKTKEILSKKSKKQKEKLGITPLPEDVKEQMV